MNTSLGKEIGLLIALLKKKIHMPLNLISFYIRHSQTDLNPAHRR